MTARNGGDAEDRADTRIPSREEGEAPVVGRYPMIAFSFNADASRLVLLYRDPSTGRTVDQIPSETALKHYEEAQKKEEKRKRLEVIVGGAAADAADGSGMSGASVTPSASGGLAVATSGGAAVRRTDGASGPAATQTAAPAPVSTPSTTPTGGTAPRVNVVI
ncbi:MAG TPA: hypothetical protein VD995_10780 [Azospirillum sp.]|nr:hypothetical protein [Azospirillum sp.]